MMAGHVLLGGLAVDNHGGEPDVKLARGHDGFARELGEKGPPLRLLR